MIGSLNEETKKSLMYFETGIIKLADNNYYLIGKGFEVEELDLIERKRLTLRKIDISIDDPVLLERRILSTEAFKLLNNAEKKSMADRNASFIYRDGSFFLLYDPVIYELNVGKYGEECLPCEEMKKNQLQDYLPFLYLRIKTKATSNPRNIQVSDCRFK